MYRHRDANSKSAPMLVINSSSEDDGDEDDADLVEYIRQDSLTTILNHRLYLAIVRKELNPAPRDTVHFFNIEETLKYENFFSDFGPLNIAMVYHYCLKVNHLMDDAEMAKKKIFHLTSNDPKKILNAAFLVGCYGIIYLHHNLQSIMKVLAPILKKISGLKYCDASQSELRYLSLKDCLGAIIKAHKLNFFDLTDFNHVAYEYYERVENGDLNWIVPGKFLAFCGPHNETRCESGMVQHSPYLYINYFRQHNVTAVIRLNMRKYDAKSFTAQGFKHYDLIFPDGSNPEEDILQKFLIICEEEKGAIAVHCKAGLGRTGTLIGAYLIKHYGFSAMEAIGWLRICRPGSVIGPQQLWLKRKQPALINEGAVFRRHHPNAANVQHQYGIYSQREECNAAGIVQGISHKVDTMRLNDDDEYLDRMQAANQMNNNTLQLKSVPAARTCQSTKWSLRSSLSRQIAIKGRSAHQSSTSTSRTPANRGRSNPAASATPSGPTIEGEPIPTRMISRRRTSTAVVTQQSSQGDQLNLIKAYRPPRNYNVPDHGGNKPIQHPQTRFDAGVVTPNNSLPSDDRPNNNTVVSDGNIVRDIIDGDAESDKAATDENVPMKPTTNGTSVVNQTETCSGSSFPSVSEDNPKINQSCHIRLDQTTATSNAECHGTSSSTDAVSDNAWFNDATKVLFMDCPGKMAVNKTGANNSATSHGRRMSTVEESIFEDPINNHLSNTNLQPNSPDKSNTIVETNDACNNIEYNCNFDVSYHVPSSSSLESLRWSNSDEDDVKGDGSNKCQSVTNNASTKALEPEDPDEINPSSGSATATSPSVGNPCKGIDYDLDVSHNLSSSSSLESYRWKRSEEDGIQDVGFNIGESVASNSVSPLNGKEQCVTNLSSGLSTAKTTVAETQTSLPLERNHQKVVVPVAKKTVILRREMPVLQMAYLTKPTGIYRQMPPPLQPAPRMFYKRAMAYRAGFHKMGNVPKYITSAPTLDQKATKSSPEGALLPGKEANKSCHTTRTHAPQAVPFIKALTPARMHRFWPSIESNVSSKIPIYSGAANSCVGHSQQPQQQQQQPQHHQQQPQQPPQKLAANDGENNNNGDVNLNFINLEHNDDTKRYKRTRSSNIIDYQKSKEKVRKLGLTSRKEAKDIKTSGICKPVAVVVQKLNIAEYDERNKPKPSSSTKI